MYLALALAQGATRRDTSNMWPSRNSSGGVRDAVERLTGQRLPSLTLASTQGLVNLASPAVGRRVLYVFPRISSPIAGEVPGWDFIPGAAGCTEQTCRFRDSLRAFAAVGYSLAGVSTQTVEELDEAANRLGITYPLIADPYLLLGQALFLPEFAVAEAVFYRRLTLVVQQSRIKKVFYPVDAARNVDEVLEWIRS
jgi:peroxiredoxin